MKYDIELDFQLLDTIIEPIEISKRLGLVPDTEMLKGERNKELDLPRQNIWSIRSTAKSDEVKAHWLELEPRLNGVINEIKIIAKSGVAKITIIINSDSRIPSVIIPSSMSKFAGYVGAVIDIDH
jgi:hypothetical protein